MRLWEDDWIGVWGLRVVRSMSHSLIPHLSSSSSSFLIFFLFFPFVLSSSLLLRIASESLLHRSLHFTKLSLDHSLKTSTIRRHREEADAEVWSLILDASPLILFFFLFLFLESIFYPSHGSKKSSKHFKTLIVSREELARGGWSL